MQPMLEDFSDEEWKSSLDAGPRSTEPVPATIAPGSPESALAASDGSDCEVEDGASAGGASAAATFNPGVVFAGWLKQKARTGVARGMKPSSDEMRMPLSPVDAKSSNSTSVTPPLISEPMVKPPRQPERALRTVMLRLLMLTCCPAQFQPDLTATASSPAQYVYSSTSTFWHE